MIRMNPAHDVRNPAGQLKIEHDRPLEEEIKRFNADKTYQDGYEKGYTDGYKAGLKEGKDEYETILNQQWKAWTNAEYGR